MFEEFCLADLTQLLQEHAHLISLKVSKYLERLLISVKPEKKFANVYSIFHIVCTSDLYKNNIPINEHFIERLKICIKCLEYLICQWTEKCEYPDNGIEKLVYMTLNHPQSRSQFKEVEEIFILGFKFEQKNSKCKPSILKSGRHKITCLNLNDFACTCHENKTANEINCNKIYLLRCFLVSNAYKYISEEFNLGSYVTALSHILDVITKTEHCQCHCHLLVAAFLYSLDFLTLELKIPNEKFDFLKWPINFFADCFAFICHLNELNGQFEKSNCSTKHDSNMESMNRLIKSLTVKLGEMETLLKNEKCEKSEMTTVKLVCSKRFYELLKQLENSVPKKIPIEWPSFLPDWYDLYLQVFKLSEHKAVIESTLKIYLLMCYDIVKHYNSSNVRELVFNQFHQLLLKRPLYVEECFKFVYSLVVNMGIEVEKLLTRLSKEEIKSYVSITLHVFPTFVDPTKFKLDKNVLWMVKLTCKLLEMLDRPSEAMKYAAMSLVRFHSQPELHKMVSLWFQILIKEISEKGSDSFKLINKDIPPNCDRSIENKALQCQLEICKNLKENPPYSYFKVLRYFTSYDKLSPNYLASLAVLSVLLHDFNCYLTYERTSLELSTEVYRARKLTKLKWEIEIIGLYSYYICIWEALLEDVCKSHKDFKWKNNTAHINSIEWFPAVGTLDQNILPRIAEICDSNFNVVNLNVEYHTELTQALNVIVIILNLHGNTLLSFKVLLFLQKVLKQVMKKEYVKMKFSVCLVHVNCRISKVLGEFHEYKEALNYAEDAKKLYQELLKTKFQGNETVKECSLMRLEIKLALTRAYLYNKQILAAFKLMSELQKDTFLTEKKTYEGVLYRARIQTLSAELYVAQTMEENCDMVGEKHHIDIVKDNVLSLFTILGQACPGICQAIVSLSFPNTDTPTFGKLTKQNHTGIVYVFELLEELFSALHDLTEKYLSLGYLKVVKFNIQDGILLSRFLLIPERELQFQVMYARCKQLSGESDFLHDQLNICNDVIKYIGDLRKGTKPMRRRLFSAAEADKEKKEKSDLKDAINNSSICEEIGCDDIIDDDIITVETLPLNVKGNVAFNKQNMASPALFRKQKNAIKNDCFTFMHLDNCTCGICRNILMTKLQSSLAEISAIHISKTDSVKNAVNGINKAISILKVHSQRSKNFLNEILDLQNSKKSSNNSVFFVDNLNCLVTLTSIYFNAGHKKPATMFALHGLNKLKGQLNSIPYLRAGASFHFILGQCMMKKYTKTLPDTSSFISTVIDSLSCPKNISSQPSDKVLSQKFENLTISKDEKAITKSETKKPLATDIKNLTKEKVKIITPQTPINAAVPKKENLNPLILQTPVITKSTRTKTKGSTSTKTPKNTRVSKLKTPATKTKKKASDFVIFNDENVPKISIKNEKPATTVKKLPVPDINLPDATDLSTSNSFLSMSITSTARKKKPTTKKVLFGETSSSSEADDDAWVPEVSEKSQTPVAVSRRPRRKAAVTSLQNIKAMRKNARKVYLQEEGPDYDNIKEEPELGRPAVKSSRSKIIARPDNDDTLEMEYDRKISNFLPDTKLGFAVEEGITEKDDLSCVKHLLTCFDLATSAGDFYLSRLSLQLLTVEQRLINMEEKLKNSKVPLFHIFSVGVMLRFIAHNFTKSKMDEYKTNEETSSLSESDKDHKKYMSSLNDLHHYTSPCYMKSLMQQSDETTVFDDITGKLPSNWSVCVMSMVEQGSSLKFLLTRLRKGEELLHIQIHDCILSEELIKFNELFQRNMESLQTTDNVLWWQQRSKTEKILKSFISDMEKKILGIYRGILLGKLVDKKLIKLLNDAMLEIEKALQLLSLSVNKKLIEIYLSIWSTLEAEEKTLVILSLFETSDTTPTENNVAHLAILFESKSIKDLYIKKRDHVILIIGKGLQNLPWESISILFPHPVSRMPSVDLLRWHLNLLELRGNLKVNLRNSAFVLNPGGDLKNTEARFSDWFKSISAWEGLVCKPPSINQWISYLQKDAFFYVGHGNGSMYARYDKVAVQRSNSCVFLMGCSSAKQSDIGISDPDGMVNYYLLSGAPCVLGCLWVVTDKDIDKYLSHLLTSWMESGSYLTNYVRKSTKVLKMRYLNGAACVTYGLPVQSHVKVENWYKKMPDLFKSLFK